MLKDKSFDMFEREEVKEPVTNHLSNVWKRDMTRYAEDFDYLLLELNQCKYVELSFDSAEEGIFFSEGTDMIVLNNLDESVWNWEKFEQNFSHIKYLIIRNCKEIPDLIFNMKQLIYLELYRCELEEFSFDNITKLSDLESLSLNESKLLELPEIIFDMNSLKVLSVMHTNIKELPQSIVKLEKLKYLGLNGTKIDHIPKVIGKLKNLTHFYQGLTDVKMLPIDMKSWKKSYWNAD